MNKKTKHIQLGFDETKSKFFRLGKFKMQGSRFYFQHRQLKILQSYKSDENLVGVYSNSSGSASFFGDLKVA